MSYSKQTWINNVSSINETKMNHIEEGIYNNSILVEKANEDISIFQHVIGIEKYDNTATYSVDDYCIYNNVLYRCLTAISVPEDFDSSKWLLQYNLVERIEYLGNKIKTASFNISVTPSITRGSVGYGEINLNISSLSASKILGISFHNSSNFMLWGTTTDISINPSSLNIYGYRLAGPYSEFPISAQIQIIYE